MNKRLDATKERCTEHLRKALNGDDAGQYSISVIEDEFINLETKLNQIRDWIADPFADVTLTDREREVIILASRGVHASVIADRFKVNRQGIYDSVRRALSKINATRGSDLSLKNLSEETYKQLERIVS